MFVRKNCPPCFKEIAGHRLLSMEDWVDKHGSGTCRHAKELKIAWLDLARHERLPFTLPGKVFSVPSTRVTIGQPLAIGDCHPFTEGQYYARKLIHNSVFEKWSGPVWMRISHDDEVHVGLGCLLQEASHLHWVPNHHEVLILISEADPKTEEYTGVVNPT